MMTTEIPPTDAAEASVHVRIGVPPGTRPGVPARVVVTVTDARTGRPVSDLRLTHSVFMHLIATRADLGTFTHVHPEPTIMRADGQTFAHEHADVRDGSGHPVFQTAALEVFAFRWGLFSRWAWHSGPRPAA